MGLESILYEKKDGVATITKNNPESMYGMSRGVLVEMRKVLEDAKNDADIRVVVITAGGEGMHFGGMALSETRSDGVFTPMEFRELMQIGHELYRNIETLEKPVIGVAKAGAMGGGLENLHACDFVIAGDTAKFSQPEIKFGLICGWGGSQRLPRLVGWRKARELLLTGDEITGKEAAEIGLVTKAVPMEKVDEEVEALCVKLKKNPPGALAFTKLAMNKVWETDFRSGLDYEIEAEGIVASCQEHPKALKAVMEGEEPVFDKIERITSGPEWQ